MNRILALSTTRLALAALVLALALVPAACRDSNYDLLCGNGVLDEGEACDDGNTDDADGCTSACEVQAVCGNGVLEDGEQCDDGNTVDDEVCLADCTSPLDEEFCQTLDPLPSGVCEVTAGNEMRLLTGDVLGPDTIYRGGHVLVDGAGQITCVGCGCANQAAGATEITCPAGIISPSLINSHDHITFIQNSPYNDTGERYEHRHDWRRGLNGHTEINASGGASGDQIRWGELRFLMGGATSTVGSGSATGFLRNLDRSAQEGLNQPEVDYQTFPLGDSGGAQLASGCGYPDIDSETSIADEDAYYPHIAEGIDAFARNEFLCTSSSENGGEDLVQPQSAFIHAVGLLPSEYAQMAGDQTSLIWSPRSNITLYGDTAVVTVADRLGVLIALGTDWMPTGSMNMQRELQCADSLNRTYYNGYFTDRDLWRMVTVNGARAAAVDDVVGTLSVGMVADIAIFDGSENPDYRAIIDAHPEDTTLVMRGGTVLYGDDALVSALAGGNCDAMDVCGTSKRLCAMDDIGQTLAQLESSAGNLYPLFYCDTPLNEPSCLPTRPTGVNGSNTYSGQPGPDDDDGDGIGNDADNCPAVFNPVRPVDNGNQADFDTDGVGDACDVCPLDADTTDCNAVDPNDPDGDGVPDGMDNCPRDSNPDQLDGDNDGKGDVCDECPTVGNPGALACPGTIYDIKQGNVTGEVGVENALVTVCDEGRGFYLQVKPGDAGYQGADYSGLFVYEPNAVCGTSISVGDRVTLNPASINEFFGQIQLTGAAVEILSSGEALPDPVFVLPADAGGDVATPLEAVLVRVENVVVTELEPTPGPGDSAPTNEFVVDGELRINDGLHLANPFPVVSASYRSITGVLNYRNGNSKLEPRDQADLELGSPVLTDFSPGQAYVRVGQSGAPTIPAPLTVSLSGPAEGDTFVAIASSDPTSLTVIGGGVTIANGMTSATVLVDGLQQSASVTLTANLDSIDLMADVRVVGAGEVPQVVVLDPANAAVPPLATVEFTVSLDIPADATLGETVTLALNPGTGGSIPASVDIDPDQISATFTFTAGGMEGSETLTATLGGSMVSAMIEIVQGGGLVLNEVNYDDPGNDSEEYVEILNVTAGPIDLTDVALSLINGNGDVEYLRIDLASAGTLDPGGYLVVGTSTLVATVPPTAKTITLPQADNNVQNGPDGLAIIDVGQGEVLDALCYEGAITAAMIPGVGTVSLVEGTATTVMDEGGVNGAMIRNPNGTDTDDAANDWAFSSTETPGEANVP